MGRVIGRTELARPPTGQRLALVTAGKEGELARIALADPAEPVRSYAQRLVPLDFLELAAAAFADAEQRLSQPRRRIMLHDPGRALRAQHALVDGMVPVALDVADAAILQMDLDAAAAGAHVAGREFDLVGARRVRLDRLVAKFPRLHGVLPLWGSGVRGVIEGRGDYNASACQPFSLSASSGRKRVLYDILSLPAIQYPR